MVLMVFEIYEFLERVTKKADEEDHAEEGYEDDSGGPRTRGLSPAADLLRRSCTYGASFL